MTPDQRICFARNSRDALLMTDSQSLFLVMVLIYGTECFTWTNLHVIAFVSWFGTRWDWTRPGRWFGNRSGGLLAKPPLPLLGTTFLCQLWPVSVSPQGVFSNVSHAVDLPWRPDGPSWFIGFDEVDEIAADGRKVYINGRYFCQTFSNAVSSHLAEFLRSLVSLTESERVEAIMETLQARLDRDAIAQRQEALASCDLGVRLSSSTLFAIVFIGGPVAVSLVGWIRCWPYLLGAIIANMALAVAVFHTAYRELYPDQKGDRRTHIAVMLLNPLSAIRAHDTLARDLFARFHPLAVAHRLCDEKTYRDFARRLLRDLRHPILSVWSERTGPAEQAERWFRERNLAAVEAFLKSTQVTPHQLLAPDPPVDETCRSYCPRCGCQFVVEQGQCDPCGGLPLVGWKQRDLSDTR